MSPKAAAKHQFYSEMAKLLEAGFGIREAAGMLAGIGLPTAQARWVEQLNQGLNQGKSITDSLDGNQATISDIERSILGAGERGGRLAPAMRHLADYFGMLAAARNETLKSLIHPFIVLHLGVFIGTVPTAMVSGGNSMASGASSFFTTLFVAYALIWLAFIATRALLRTARGNAGIDRLIHRLPLIGKARSSLAMAGFCRVYHTCLLAAIPMRETVRMAAAASQSGMIREAGSRLENTVAEGNPLGPQFVAESAFPKAFARTYSTGEVAGTLDTDLMNWSKHFQNEAEAGARTLATVIPKILYLLILLYAGWKIVGFFNGYYEGLLKELE